MGNLEKPITTQEELNAVIGDRLQREREQAAKRYEGWKSPEDLQKLTEQHNDSLAQLTAAKDAEIKALQEAAEKTKQDIADRDSKLAESAKYKTELDKTRIALAAGLDLKYVDRIKGETEDEWKADAEMLAKDFAAAHRTPPIGSPELRTTPVTQKELEKEAFGKMLKDI